ncbi:class I SAM-dependent methyltransferase [Paenibacillus solisilvae]|uniref:Class I SAM-dependent methyltransferase n=1 Tax=Paenibacillus solisilvae TaxID=2486751 RepID=A0ABW0W3S2_9BACL
MPEHNEIYASQAHKYHQLIAKQPDLTAYINEIRPISGLDIVDLGAGTGRFTTGLAVEASSIAALDASEAMLQINANRLGEAGLTNWRTQAADHRSLPLGDNTADLIISGWSICYLCSTDNPDWELNIRQILGEARRVLRDGGTMIIMETLGTGHETPCAPDFLTGYYEALVNEHGFSHRWIRADYEFEDAGQAEELTRFFFGDELADHVAQQHITKLPECAGIWWLHL